MNDFSHSNSIDFSLALSVRMLKASFAFFVIRIKKEVFRLHGNNKSIVE